MACHALDSVRIEIHSYLYLYQQTWMHLAGFGFVCVPGTVVKPKSDGTAVAWSTDDTLFR